LWKVNLESRLEARRHLIMGVLVRIPTPLRRLTKGQDKLDVSATTISEMIEKLETSYPGFRERLVDEGGELRYFVNIYLNGEDVRFLKGLKTPMKSGDEISIVPAVAGG
jgi:molybdopterin synthase sulfur carrier subunit